MFIAHLPAGYLCAKLTSRRSESPYRRLIFWSIVIGSVLPDVDMFYFHLIDNRQTHHHLYWTHLPSFWLVGYLIISVISILRKNKRLCSSTPSTTQWTRVPTFHIRKLTATLC